jgi:hypothetical protein
VKGPNGKLSPDQHEFGRAVTLAGGHYYVVRGIDDVIGLGI